MGQSQASPQETQFYKRLRRTIKIWAGGEQSEGSRFADYILAAPDLFMLLVGLSRDERVSSKDRTRIAGAIAYFINPLDFVPEAVLGPPGLVDDVALAAYVLHEMLEKTDPTIIREHWQGDADILDLVRQILMAADAMVGGSVWRRLIARAESFVPFP